MSQRELLSHPTCELNMNNSSVYKEINKGIKLRLFPAISLLILIFISVISIVISFSAIGRQGYSLMFLLPIMFIFLLVAINGRFNEIPSNIGFTLVLGIEFIRLVLVPVLFVIGDYPETITYKAEANNLYGILLQVYEVLWIAYALQKKTSEKKLYQVTSFDDQRASKRITRIVLFAMIITAGICIVAPEILLNYRLITMATDKEFTNLEQSFVVNAYASSSIKKFFLVLANYILKPMRLIVPAFIMHVIYKMNRRSSWTKPISLFLALSPFIFVDGTVARSLYFSIVLLFFYNKLYGMNIKRLGIAIGAAVVFIFAYWIVRYNSTMTSIPYTSYFGEKLNDYFCGFNIVGAVDSLPKDIAFRFKYFAHDYIRCIPFANTLFNLDGNDTVRVFFNTYTNAPNGQIPATLAMGCYYFTPLFAPIYSYVFTRLAINYGNKARIVNNPYYTMVWNLCALYFALGIGVNDVSVTLSNFVQVILPVMIMIRVSYPYDKGEPLI